jgi:hypothetical protein
LDRARRAGWRELHDTEAVRHPDGNSWVLQEVTNRLPGRIDPTQTVFGTANDLASVPRRAEFAHGEHQQRIGRGDPNWPGWDTHCMMAEQAGAELPT